MNVKKRDLIFVALVLCVFGTFFAISGKTKTKRVPLDEIHTRFYEMVRVDGKKETEKFCKDCHLAERMPLPKDHPPPFRCLFCHKLIER